MNRKKFGKLVSLVLGISILLVNSISNAVSIDSKVEEKYKYYPNELLKTHLEQINSKEGKDKTLDKLAEKFKQQRDEEMLAV